MILWGSLDSKPITSPRINNCARAHLPFGNQIYYAVGGVNINYPILGIPITTLVPAVFNGVTYGFIVWLIYSVVSAATGKGKAPSQTIQQNVTVQVQDKEKDVQTQKSKNETDKDADAKE